MDAELVAALLTARDDPASGAFEESLRGAEAAGRIDAATARELRYWHQRALEGLIEHAAVVLPAAEAARRRSDAGAREATAEARISWQQARALAASAAGEDAEAPADDPGAPSRRAGGVGLSVVSDED